MNYKSGRGGVRRGAGRPVGTGKPIVSERDRRNPIGIRLPAYILNWLKAQDEKPGRLIELALLEKFGRLISKGK